MSRSLRHAVAVGASLLLTSGAALAFNPQPDPPGRTMTPSAHPWRMAQRATTQSPTGIIILDKPGTKGLGGPDTRALNPNKGSLKGIHEVDEKSKFKAGGTIDEKSKRKAGTVIEEKSKSNWKAFHDVEKSKKPK